MFISGHRYIVIYVFHVVVARPLILKAVKGLVRSEMSDVRGV